MSRVATRTDKTPVILLGVLLCGLAAVAAVGLVAGGVWLVGKGRAGDAATGPFGPSPLGAAAVVASGPDALDAAKFTEIQQAFRADEAAAAKKYMGRRYSVVVEKHEPFRGTQGLLLAQYDQVAFAVVLEMRPRCPAPLSTGRYAVVGTLALVQPDGPLAPFGGQTAPVILLQDAVAERLTAE